MEYEIRLSPLTIDISRCPRYSYCEAAGAHLVPTYLSQSMVVSVAAVESVLRVHHQESPILVHFVELPQDTVGMDGTVDAAR